MLAAVGFYSGLFGAEGDNGVLLCRGTRGDYSRDKCEYHADDYKHYSTFPRKYCADIVKSREVLDDPGDREAEEHC